MLLSQWIRLIRKDNTTYTDISLSGQNTDIITFDMNHLEDYLYVGQYYPFTNLFFEVNTVNALASTLGIEHWNGSEWVSVVDILDGTLVSGATMARDGVVSWSIDMYNEEWQIVQDTSSNTMTDLDDFKLYNLYWIRIRPSATLTAGCKLDKVSYAFTTGEILKSIFPEIDSYLTSWSATKTDWNEQIRLASNHVVTDLKAKGLIKNGTQIINFEDICIATAYKALQIIFAPLGDPFKDKRNDFIIEYNRCLSIKRFDFDQNSDGKLTPMELESGSRKLIR